MVKNIFIETFALHSKDAEFCSFIIIRPPSNISGSSAGKSVSDHAMSVNAALQINNAPPYRCDRERSATALKIITDKTTRI